VGQLDHRADRELGAIERPGGYSAGEHDHPVGELDELVRLGRGDHDGAAGAGELTQDSVQVLACADVDAFGGLVEQQQPNGRAGALAEPSFC